jgi:chromate transporter
LDARPQADSTPPCGTGSAVPAPSRADLFRGFLSVGLQGFGGVLPFARRMLVEDRRWLSEREFVEVLSLSQFLPGPNVVNAAVIVGNRYGGPLGSVVSLLGLLLMPVVIAIALTMLYTLWSELAPVRGAAYGVTSAATGLVIATGLRMGTPIRGVPWQVGVAAATFLALGVLRVPLLWALAALLPLSIAIAWRARRQDRPGEIKR